MFSAAGSKVGPHRAALLASSAAGALAAAAAALVPRGEEGGPEVDGDGGRGGPSRPTSDAGGRFGPLRDAGQRVLRAGPLPNPNGPSARGRCSCEMKIPFVGKGGRQQTLRLFDRTSNKATLESKYKVRRESCGS